jgi:anti-sigma B factor antagonist
MDLTVEDAGEAKVVRIAGKLDTRTSIEAEVALRQLVDAGCRKLVLNCQQLEYISSAGLRILLATAKQLQASGGELRVCSLSDLVQEVFEISGFDGILLVSKTEAEALASF